MVQTLKMQKENILFLLKFISSFSISFFLFILKVSLLLFRKEKSMVEGSECKKYFYLVIILLYTLFFFLKLNYSSYFVILFAAVKKKKKKIFCYSVYVYYFLGIVYI